MSKKRIGSPAPLTRIKKNQSKSRRSRTNGCRKGDAIKGVFIPMEETLHGGLGNQIAYGGANDPDGKFVTTAIRSLAPSNDMQQFSMDISPRSPHFEGPNTSENLLTLDVCGSPFIDISDECFAPETPGNTASALQTNPDHDLIWNLSEEEAMDAMTTMTAMGIDSSCSSPFPPANFDLSHSSVASSPDTAFDFNLEMEVDLNLPLAKFPTGNWSVPNFPAVFTDPSTMGEGYTDPSQLQQTRFCTDLGKDAISSGSRSNSDEMTLLFNSSFYDQCQEQSSPTQKETTIPLIKSCFDHIGDVKKTLESSPLVASSGNGSRKQLSSGNNLCNGDEDTNLTNCEPLPRDSGGKLFACPFHKKDPQRYQDCGRYTLRRIKDVKQHIYRLHSKPELYCSRCFESFKYPDERDDHIRKGGCTLQEVPNRDDTISDNQRKELKECKSRGTSKYQQWMELWGVIFPETTPPRSPHIESGQEELICSLRRYWAGNAEEIIAKSVDKYKSESLNSNQIREVVDSILDHFGAHLTNRDLEAVNETGGTLQPSRATENSFDDLLSHLYLLD